MILAIVIVFTCITSGCITSPRSQRVEKARQERAAANAEYGYRAIYLGYPSIYLVKFEGHDYLTRGSNSHLLHTVSCKGVHDGN